jgi:hypothetical protein
MKKLNAVLVLGLFALGILCGILLAHKTETAVNNDQPLLAEVTTNKTPVIVAAAPAVTNENKVLLHVAKISFAPAQRR